MRTTRFLAVVAAGILLGATLTAQEKPGDIALVYSVKPKLANLMQLDAAMKRHFEWHRANKDTFSWVVWQVASGENMGDFMVGTFGHHWKEFDARAAFDEKDDADFFANVIPLVEKADLGYWTFLADVSRPASSSAPTAMAQITHYFLKPDGYAAFMDALKELKAATEKASYPMTYEWWRLVSGGEGPQLVLAIDRNSFAEMEPPAKSLDQALAEAVGPQKAVALMSEIRGGTRFTRSYLLRYRPDLSYAAPK
jgi:hypothetical protein